MPEMVLYDETDIPRGLAECSCYEMSDAVYAKGEDFYDSIPDIEFDGPVIVIAEISDGCGNLVPSCWELCGRSLAACFEPVDAFHSFCVDGRGDLWSRGIDLRNGISYYLYRVFREEIGHDEQQWLIDLINGCFELDSGVAEEIERCTLPVGTVFMKKDDAAGKIRVLEKSEEKCQTKMNSILSPF